MLMVAALAFATSCKKDEDEKSNSPAKTKTELLTSGSWKITSLILGGTDLWPSQDACDKDDLAIFKTDGTYIDDEGATKCDPADPQQTTSTWKFTNNETVLEIDGDAGTIKELTESKLVIEATSSGVTVTVTYGK